MDLLEIKPSGKTIAWADALTFSLVGDPESQWLQNYDQSTRPQTLGDQNVCKLLNLWGNLLHISIPSHITPPAYLYSLLKVDPKW